MEIGVCGVFGVCVVRVVNKGSNWEFVNVVYLNFSMVVKNVKVVLGRKLFVIRMFFV